MTVQGPLVWIDLEMTGLEPSRERIIEIATVVTDGDLVVVAEGPDLVIHQPDALLEGMDEWNRRHHGDSGLTEAVRRSTLTEAEAEAETLRFVAQHCAKGKAPLAGNSVHTDRWFLHTQMPSLEGWLHYRNVDVSTVKELARRWSPGAFTRRPSKKGNHRARDDVLESIEELRYYREALFKGRTPPVASPPGTT